MNTTAVRPLSEKYRSDAPYSKICADGAAELSDAYVLLFLAVEEMNVGIFLPRREQFSRTIARDPIKVVALHLEEVLPSALALTEHA
jgi:hypothetical protein